MVKMHVVAGMVVPLKRVAKFSAGEPKAMIPLGKKGTLFFVIKRTIYDKASHEQI